MATELIALQTDIQEDPKFATCYARGASFKPEGKFFRVEKGARTVVHRSLCLTHYYGRRCEMCPFSKITVKLEVP